MDERMTPDEARLILTLAACDGFYLTGFAPTFIRRRKVCSQADLPESLNTGLKSIGGTDV